MRLLTNEITKYKHTLRKTQKCNSIRIQAYCDLQVKQTLD